MLLGGVGRKGARDLADAIARSTAAAQQSLKSMQAQVAKQSKAMQAQVAKQSEAMQKSFKEAMAFANERTDKINTQIAEYNKIVARTGKQSAENQTRTAALSAKLNSLGEKLDKIENRMVAVSSAAKTLKETTDRALNTAGNIDEKREAFEEMYEQFKKKLAALLYVLGDSGGTGRDSPDSFGGVKAATTSPVITVSPDSGETGRGSPDSFGGAPPLSVSTRREVTQGQDSSSNDNDLYAEYDPTHYYRGYSSSDSDQEEDFGFAPVELANSNLKW